MAITKTENVELRMKNTLGKSRKVLIKNPSASISSQDAKNALDKLVDQDIFEDESGDRFASAVGAYKITRTQEDIYQAN